MAKTKTDGYGNYKGTAEDRDLILGGLPPIAGTWYFVDPTDGLAANDGLAPGSAKANIFDAVALMESGAGDGVANFARGDATSETTSYVTAAKTLAQHGCRIVGIGSDGLMFQRTRIANNGDVAKLLTISGDNNVMEGMHLWNGGDDAADIGCLEISGNRNTLKRCHLVGAGHATPGAVAGAYSLFLNGAEEATFEDCVFGTDTIAKEAANGELLIDGGVLRTVFRNCIFLSHSATAGKGSIKVADATAMSGVMLFENCTFINWNPNALTAVDACVIGTCPTSGHLLFKSCGFFGFTAVAGAGFSGHVWTADCSVVASGAGGISTTM